MNELGCFDTNGSFKTTNMQRFIDTSSSTFKRGDDKILIRRMKEIVLRKLGLQQHVVDWLQRIQPQLQKQLLLKYSFKIPKILQVLLSSVLMIGFWLREWHCVLNWLQQIEIIYFLRYPIWNWFSIQGWCWYGFWIRQWRWWCRWVWGMLSIGCIEISHNFICEFSDMTPSRFQRYTGLMIQVQISSVLIYGFWKRWLVSDAIADVLLSAQYYLFMVQELSSLSLKLQSSLMSLSLWSLAYLN